MKYARKNRSVLLLLVPLAAGAVGIMLRALLYLTGFDEKGLMSNTHPLHLLCWALTIGVAIFLAISIRKLDGTDRCKDSFPENTQSMGLVAIAAVWFLLSAFSTMRHISDKMDVAWTVLGFAAVPCLLYTGYCRMKGKRPSFVFHAVVCVYFAIDMVCRYRTWSGNPQLPDYTFHLFACVFLTLTAYYRLAFDVGLGKRRMFLFCSLMAAFFCMLAFIEPDVSHFHIGGGFWAISGLSQPNPQQRRSTETQEEA